jgi:hypothetical protein
LGVLFRLRLQVLPGELAPRWSILLSSHRREYYRGCMTYFTAISSSFPPFFTGMTGWYYWLTRFDGLCS